MAGALTDNDTDIASLGWNVKLLLHSSWGLWYPERAVYDLVRYGADVINFSWGGNILFPSLEIAIEYALQHGRVCVAAAGNDYPIPPKVIYPAAYNFADLGQVIAVSATEMIGNVEQFKPDFNYSPGTDPINDPTNAFIDCSAPGTNYRALSGLSSTGTVHIWSGTSISAPFVSALVGLMLSVNSTLTPVEVYDIIKGTTDRIGIHSYSSIGWNQYLGYGRIDAANAVNVANGAPPKPRDVNVVESANHHPYLTWEENVAPDFDHYKLYKNEGNGWQYHATVYSEYFEDTDEIYCQLHPKFCTGERVVSYYVIAVDNTSNESVPSNTVSALLIDGAPEKIVINPNSTEPIEYSLIQNYPNPFNPTTRIDFSIKKDGFVTLKVFDILGKEVANLVNERIVAGSYSVSFNASTLPSGIYVYRLTSGKFSAAKKLILMK